MTEQSVPEPASAPTAPAAPAAPELDRAPRLRWAVIGCGDIANRMADDLAAQGRGFDGVANRTHAKAVAYAERHNVPRVYESVADLAADPDIDAVYVASTHNLHLDHAREVLAAGKHVLCEKAVTLNLAELEELEAIAARTGAVFMDACTILHMPLYKDLRRRLEAGEFGKVHMVQVNFGSFVEYSEDSRFWSANLAGGAMLDIGVYAITMARTFLASCPTECIALENPAFTGVDEESAIALRNPDGELCTVSLTLHAKQPKRYVVATDRGYLEGIEYPRADEAAFTWWPENRRETFRLGSRELALNYAVADLEAAVAGEAEALRCVEWSRDVMRVMTDLRHQWEFRYPEERGEGHRA